MAMVDAPWRDRDRLVELYHEEGLSVSEIAERWECHRATIRKWLRKNDVEQRSHAEEVSRGRRRNDHGSVRTDYHGYERVTSRYEGKNDVVKIHRLVAVAEHGVDAVANAEVHHKNDIPWDNRPENLQVLTPGEHSSVHMSEYWENQDRPWTDGELLSEMYHERGMTRAEIAEALDCSKYTVSTWFGKHDIKTRMGPSKS